MSSPRVPVGDLVGRRAIVTGGTSGLGRETATALAARGAQVLLTGRDAGRGRAAAAAVAKASGNPDVHSAVLDLGELASVRGFAANLEGPVDLLVNNAGVMAPPRRAQTADGFERQFGTNHLGHFALTGLLLSRLLESSEPRVVSVSSLAHWQGGTDVVDGNQPGPYNPIRTYGNSKLAALLFAAELQRRAPDRMVSAAAHPGVAATGLFTSRDGMGANPVIRLGAGPVVRVFGQSARAAARSLVFAATAATPGSFTGPTRFFGWRGPIGEAPRSRAAQDPELARELWAVSESLTGVHWAWPSGGSAPGP